jgi:hypothetical protein
MRNSMVTGLVRGRFHRRCGSSENFGNRFDTVLRIIFGPTSSMCVYKPWLHELLQLTLFLQLTHSSANGIEQQSCGRLGAELFLANLRCGPRLVEEVGESEGVKEPGHLSTVPYHVSIAPTGTKVPPVTPMNARQVDDV